MIKQVITMKRRTNLREQVQDIEKNLQKKICNKLLLVHLLKIFFFHLLKKMKKNDKKKKRAKKKQVLDKLKWY